MRIGSLDITPPVLMAPMAGYTDSPFRRVLRRCGCPAVVSEMVSAEGLIRGGAGTLALLDHTPEEQPLLAQLFGARPESMAAAAELVAERGFAAIDINMGCPVKKVVRSGAGAALLREPERAAAVLTAVRRAVDLPLTAKLRSGWTAAEINAVEVARRLADAGADGLIIHPRTRAQYYAGRADWRVIGQVVAAVDIPVVGNGDLRRPADGRAMRDQTGCAGLMVGRAALGDPFLPAALVGTGSPPTAAQRLDAFCTHLELVVAWLGSERRAVQRMRKHLTWYARGLPGAAALRRELPRLERSGEMRAAYERLLFAVPGEKPERTPAP